MSSERRLAAVLSADAVGYSRLMAHDDAATVDTITTYRRRIATLVEGHAGRVVDAPGDNLLAEFPAASEAVRCALAVQRAIEERNADLSEERRMHFRVGVHVGELIAEDDRIYGDGVNVAARLEALAEPGGICVSRAVVEQVRGRVPLSFDDLGEQRLKNIPEPVRVYRVREAPQAARAAVPTRGPRRLRIVGLLPIAIPFVLLAVLWWLLGGPRPRVPASLLDPSRIRSIAVLPLDNHSGDPAQEYFADGMTEALIADLAKIRSLRVISRTSVMRYKGTTRPLPEIAQELGADAIVEGSVLRAGGRVRVTAQLIRAATDEHLWSERYDRELADVLDLQAEVARTIAGEIRAAVSPEEDRLLTGARAVDPEALDAYLRGRQLWTQRGPALLDAIAAFERALEIDPAYAGAWVGLAEAYSLLPFYGVGRWRDVVTPAREAADRALQLDPGRGDAWTVLAWLDLGYRGDKASAEDRFGRAIELSPNEPTAYLRLSWMLLIEGRIAEADALLRRALELDPLSPVVLYVAGWNRVQVRDYDAAIDFLSRSIETSPGFWIAREGLVMGLQLAGRSEEAERHIDALPDAGSRARARLLNRLLTRAADEEVARRVRAELAALAPLPASDRHTLAPGWEASAWLRLGEAERAIEGLESYYRTRPTWARAAALTVASLEPLEGDPRFDALVAELVERPSPSPQP